MEILENFSLKKYNTFGIEAKAKQFVAVHSTEELQQVLAQHPNEKKIHFRRRQQYAVNPRH